MASRISLASLAILTASIASLAAADYQLTNDSTCDCYVSNGIKIAYYTYHVFFDFRNLSQYIGEPDVLTSINDSANALATSDYFTTDAWNNVWTIQSWNSSDGGLGNHTIYMQNSANNIYIDANSDVDATSQTYMTLRTQRLDDFQTAAEIDSTSTGFQFVSMRMLARTVGSPGACTGMFTYRQSSPAPSNGSPSSPDVQEADLEVLTKDPRNMIQYTNQPSLSADGDIINQATANATMPDGLDWSQWAVHRYDWTPNQSTWYVDGVQVAAIAFQAPRDPSQIVLNAWSDGGDWTGNMTLHDAAYLQVQWFEMVYNNTDGKTSKRGDGERRTMGSGLWRRDDGCKNVCSIDDTSVQGTPVLVSVGAHGKGVTPKMVAWIPIVLVLIVSSL